MTSTVASIHNKTSWLLLGNLSLENIYTIYIQYIYIYDHLNSVFRFQSIRAKSQVGVIGVYINTIKVPVWCSIRITTITFEF